MQRRSMLAATGAAMILGAGASRSDGASDFIEIEGAFGYRERIALLPGATGIVSVLDVSRLDAPARIIQQTHYPLDGRSPPFGFRLRVGAELFGPGMRHVVRAEIRGADDRLLWTTDRAYPIDPAKAVNAIGLITLVKVSANGGADRLLDRDWTIQSAAGTARPEHARASIRFAADGSVSGASGCNRFSGRYTRSGDRLRLGQLATTRMACIPQLEDFEATVLGLLGEELAYRAENGLMILRTPDGRELILAAQ